MRSAGEPRPPPPLAEDAHKGDAGRALCVVGSRTMPGAAVLVARAAQRAGAGLVVVACLDPALLAIVPAAAPEAILVEPETEDLRAGGRALFAARDCHARLAGPGLGDDARTRLVVRGLLASDFAGPLVLDADALNALDGEPERLRDARGPVVITPHPGEAARLAGAPVSRDPAARADFARALAQRCGAIVCLKGKGTVVTDGDALFVNPTGNPGMATAGAGDVLSGILVAYLARAAAFRPLLPGDALAAARRAVYVHGLAGDLAAGLLGQEGLVASDLIERLPHAQRKLVQG